MAKVVRIDRDRMTEVDGNDVEQAPVEIKVLETEDALVREAARIIGDDQFGVVMLHAFIVGDRIVFVSKQGDDDEGGQKHDGGDIMGFEARDPSQRVAQRQSSRRNAWNALPSWLQVGHYSLGPGARYGAVRARPRKTPPNTALRALAAK